MCKCEKLILVLFFVSLFFVSFQKETNYNHKEQVANLISFYKTRYQLLNFENKTSAFGQILNETKYNWSTKQELKKKSPYYDKNGKSYYTRFYFISYQYNDSLDCEEAFELYLTNFGTMGVPIKRNRNLESFKNIPLYLVKNKESITVVYTNCEYQNKDWNEFKQRFKSNFYTKNKSIAIDCGCGGPLNWEKIN